MAAAQASRRRRRGATFVHAFEDERVIAGPGTIGLGARPSSCRTSGTLVVPIGGGGLAAGIAIALAALKPGVRIVGDPGGTICTVARRHRALPHDRRGHRGQAARAR